MKRARLTIIILVVIFILLVPFIAMQYTDEVNWTLPDFVFGGILLFGFGLLMDYALRKLSKSKHKIAIGTAIVVVFILIWMELAVGIFGSPFAGS